MITPPENRSHKPRSEKISVSNASTLLPQKRQIKTRIAAKSHKSHSSKCDSPIPPTTPPSERVASSKTPLSSPLRVNEVVFQHSGRKMYDIQDGDVRLFPYQNKHAYGGFSVEIRQNGKFVGLIAAGQEVACRKYLVIDSL